MTAEEARRAFLYNPETGILTWRVAPFRRTDLVGKVAGCRRPDGYTQIRVKNKFYLAHRIAWLMVTGAWPKAVIDHINGVCDDNRWTNLRDVSQSKNMQNQHRHRAGKPLWVSYHKPTNRFHVFLPRGHPTRTETRRYHYHSEHKTLLEAKVVSQLLILEAEGIL